VQKSYGGSTTVYVYDAFGRLNSEYLNGNWSRDYIVDGSGNLMATENASGLCTTCYFGTDHLGSVRIVMDQYANVVARHDYLPFGEELLGTAGRTTPGFNVTNDVTQKFTGQIRDQESGEDFSNARYFTAGLGRFNSADPMNAGADLLSAQSWNGYGYVLGNPLGLVDPSGTIEEQPPVDSGGSQQPGQPIVIPVGINVSRFNILVYLKSFHGTGTPEKSGTNVSNQISCSTALPNGQTVGAVVRKQRAILQSYVQGANDAAANGVPAIPLATIYGSFYAIAQGNGPIDFKNNFPAADRNTMGLSGNLAYYAIGAGYFPNSVLDLGAAYYAIKAAFTPGTSVHYSDLTGHFFSDTAAATEKGPGLASNGCGG